jgi:hypothetical protein
LADPFDALSLIQTPRLHQCRSDLRDLVAGLQFEERGVHTLKGVPGTWPLYSLADGGKPDGASDQKIESLGMSARGAAPSGCEPTR